MHTLQPIGARPLHPMEALIVAAVTEFGNHARQCSCGLLICAATALEVRCRHTEHARLAAVRETT